MGKTEKKTGKKITQSSDQNNKNPKTKYGMKETIALNNLFKRFMSAGKANSTWVLFLKVGF